MDNSAILFDVIRTLVSEDVEPEELERKLWDRFGLVCAVLVLDSARFSAATQTHGIVHFLKLIVQFRDIVESVVARHGCTGRWTEADNFYGQFSTPDSALQAAIEANRAIAAEGLMVTENQPFQICGGIGYGKCLFSQTEGVYGSEMNLAAKLGEDIAAGKEILLTESAHSNLSEKNRTGLRFEKRDVEISGLTVEYFSTRI